MWIARFSDGNLGFWCGNEKPELSKYKEFWACRSERGMYLSPELFPDLTLENSPREVTLVDITKYKESLGDHLRNLLTPYKCLLEAIKSNDPKVLEFIKNRPDFKEGLDKLIEFSKSDIMEKINYEKIRKE